MIRAYFVITSESAPPPTEDEWQAIVDDAITGSTLHSAIQNPGSKYTVLSHNHIHAHKRSQNSAHRLKYTMLAFELDDAYGNSVIALMEAEAVAREITGISEGDRFRQVMQAEIREAALRQGFTPTQANELQFQIVAGYGDRETAIRQAQAYIAANSDKWHE